MNFFTSDTIKKIRAVMKTYGIPQFEKSYVLRISKKRTSKIKKLSVEEAQELLKELQLWTKDYLVKNILNLITEAGWKCTKANQFEIEKSAIDFLVRYAAKEYVSTLNVNSLHEISYLNLLAIANSASNYFLRRSVVKN